MSFKDISTLEFSKLSLREDCPHHDDLSKAFEFFCHRLLQKDDPTLPYLLRSGPDGGIDQFQSVPAGFNVVECKYHSHKLDSDKDAETRLKTTLNTLAKNLKKPAPGQRYAPWLETSTKIQGYIYCYSQPITLGQQSGLKSIIKSKFQEIAQDPRYAHLANLSVDIWDWGVITGQFNELRSCFYRWFNFTRPGLKCLITATPKTAKKEETRFQDLLHGGLSYYSRREFLDLYPDAKGTINSEGGLLDALQNNKELLLYSSGGMGKSRLLRQLGLLALERGWLVYEARDTLNSDKLGSLRCFENSNQPILILLDYLEKRDDLQSLRSELEELRENYNMQVFLIGSCRKSYYLNITDEFLLEEDLDQGADGEWQKQYNEQVIHHILSKAEAPEAFDDCKGHIVFAALLLFFSLRQGKRVIKPGQDFKAWLLKKLEQSYISRSSSLSTISWVEKLAGIFAHYPLSPSQHADLDLEHGELIEKLVQDGWIESNEHGFMQVIHDSITDQLLLEALCKCTIQHAENRLKNYLVASSQKGSIQGLIVSLFRVKDELPALNWNSIMESLNKGSLSLLLPN